MLPRKKLYEVQSKIAGLGGKNRSLLQKSSSNIMALRRKTQESLLLLKKLGGENLKEEDAEDVQVKDLKRDNDVDMADKEFVIRRLSDANLSLTQEN